MKNKTVEIEVRICVPNDMYCAGCDFQSSIYTNFTEQSCLIFDEKLRYLVDGGNKPLVKCDRCFALMTMMEML